MLDLDRWAPLTAVNALWEGQLAAVAAVRPALGAIAAAAEAAASRLRQRGRLIYCGAGTSGRLGVLDASELPPTFDWPPERLHHLLAGGAAALTQAVENAEDRADLAEADVVFAKINDCDVLIAVAACVRPFNSGGNGAGTHCGIDPDEGGYGAEGGVESAFHHHHAAPRAGVARADGGYGRP
jgi:N-acetylmuramic acid 6-phosphate (MurNAc-6-P) etherase